MARPDPALLDPARYPFHCEIETRYGDLDSNWHINNVALTGMLEEARVRFHRHSGYKAVTAEMTSMVASLAIEFLGQSYHPDPLEMHVALQRLGRTSYTLQQLVTQRGRTIAVAQATMVCMADGKPVPIPQVFIDSAQPWMLLA